MRHEIPRHWRLQDERYRLEGEIDLTTNKVRFPKSSRQWFPLEPEANAVNKPIPIQISLRQEAVTSSVGD